MRGKDRKDRDIGLMATRSGWHTIPAHTASVIRTIDYTEKEYRLELEV